MDKYKKIWRKCEFLKTNYYKYAIIINGRRINNIKKLQLKINNILSQSKKNMNFLIKLF